MKGVIGQKRGTIASITFIIIAFAVIAIAGMGLTGSVEAAFEVTSCSDCHANPPVDGTARDNPSGAVIGSHDAHVTQQGIACATCHLDHGSNYGHRDGTIQIADPIAGGSYSLTNPPQDNEDGTGLGSCSSTACHGGTSDKWGTDLSGFDECTRCHGTKTAAPATDAQKAPPVNLAGDSGTVTDGVSDDAKVGAHQAHINLPLGLTDALNSTGNCNECHLVPGSIGAADHINDGTPGVAEVFPGTITPEKAADNGVTVSYSGGTCTTYCHGANMPKSTDNATPPDWNTNLIVGSTPSLTDYCDKCHEAPPTGLAPHSASHTINDCDECHTHFNNDGTLTAGANRALHINGTVEFSSDCNSCHGYAPDPSDGKTGINPEGKGAHAVHVANIIAADGLAALSPSGDSYLNHAVCDYCHDTSNAANHNNGTVNMRGPAPLSSFAAALQFGSTEAEYLGTVGSDHTASLKTCSNIACHYQTSPEWESY